MTARTIDLVEHFWSKTCPEPNSGCILWTGSLSPDGYGLFWGDAQGHGKRQNIRSHRYAFRLGYGRWPDRLVLHKCDTRSCVNIEHLFEGSAQDNTDDMCRKGRHVSHNKYKTHCIRGHELPDAPNTPNGYRRCVLCDETKRKPMHEVTGCPHEWADYGHARKYVVCRLCHCFPPSHLQTLKMLSTARAEAFEEAAREAESCIRDECSPGYIAKRIRAQAERGKP